MENKELKSSRTFIGTRKVCIYCGKELGFANDSEALELFNTLFCGNINCDCENALKELEMKKEIFKKIAELEKFINENGYPKEVVDKMKDYVEQYPASVDLKAEIKAV